MALELVMVGLALLGFLLTLLLVLAVGLQIARGVRAHIAPEVIPLTVRFGTWAVVTGSTDGIGRAYALELAKRGVNIVLVSRNQKKLDDVVVEITSRHFVKTKTIAVDFSKGKEVFEVLKKELADIPVGILVNNVGRQYKYPMYLAEVEEEELWDIININIGATTMMTRIVLPEMAKRRKGAIVNISSGSELQPLPLMTVYAASKVFIKSFSQALRFEYRKRGITIQHLSPMFVNTKMNDFSPRLRQTKLFVPDAETYARSAVNTLGIVDHSTGYWAHGIQSFMTVLPPVWVRTYVGGIMNQIFRNDYYKSVLNEMGGKDYELKKGE